MTRKQYVVSVTADIQENPKAVLSGHKLQSQLLTLIAKRPDVIAKMAALAFSSKMNKRGSKALKKSGNFRITAYKNFANFNFNSRKDVESFMAGLSPDDAAKFSNSNNILTLIVLPDTTSDNVEIDIANGKSVAVAFDSAVKKEYKISGGFYVNLMFGDSYILPAQEKIAAVKEPANKRIQSRRTPAKIRAELTTKAKAKLIAIKKETGLLASKAVLPLAGYQQITQLGKAAGVQDGADPKAIIAGIKAFNIKNRDLIKSLDPGDLVWYKKAVALYAKGKTVEANRILAEVGIPELTELVRGGNVTNIDQVAAARRKQFNAQVRALSAKNAELLGKIETAKSPRDKAALRFALNKNIKAIKVLKAKAASHKDLKITSIKDKMKMVIQIQKQIEANLAKGNSIQASLQLALAKLPVDQEVKQQVRQDVIQQMADSTPMQYAVQQAMQNIQATPDEMEQQVIDDSILDATTAASLGTDYGLDELDADLDTDELIGDVSSLDDNEFDDIATTLAGSKSIASILKSL